MSRMALFSILLLTIYSCNANASAGAGGVGDIAANLYEPFSVVIQLVQAVSIICGSGLLLGSVLRFIEYRRNPAAVRLSAVVFMVFFGIGLIITGLIPLHLMGVA